jgi:hypothetical protein
MRDLGFITALRPARDTESPSPEELSQDNRCYCEQHNPYRISPFFHLGICP